LKVFTYKDYIDCIHKLRLNAIFQLAEESASYDIGKEPKKKSIIKMILEDKHEATEFINKYLKSKEKIKEKDIELYKSKYIERKYKDIELPIIYRHKNTETFFLIEHIDFIDRTIDYKILNYCIDIIYEWSKEKRFNSKTNYPRVVPIVIYTGQEPWNSQKRNREKTIGTNVLENYKIDIQLNVIETDEPEGEEPEEDKTWGYKF